MLLRVLETGEVMPIGVRKVKQVDIRVVAATNRDLQEMMKKGLFSDALYFRLCQFEIQLLPLRQKGEDILLLARHFLVAAAHSRGAPVPSLSNDASALLCTYQWPGNVRELKGCMEYALAVAKSGEITPSSLPPRVCGEQEFGAQPTAPRASAIARRVLLVDALRQTGGNQSQAAKILGVSRQAVHQMIRRFEVEDAEWQ
jgi:Nif-specific regulatory protein